MSMPRRRPSAGSARIEQAQAASRLGTGGGSGSDERPATSSKRGWVADYGRHGRCSSKRGFSLDECERMVHLKRAAHGGDLGGRRGIPDVGCVGRRCPQEWHVGSTERAPTEQQPHHSRSCGNLTGFSLFGHI